MITPVSTDSASWALPAAIGSAEYLGNKRLLVSFITAGVMKVRHSDLSVVDLFSGTGVVSAAFKRLGYSVTANDHLAACGAMTGALLLNSGPPRFQGLLSEHSLEAPPELPAYSRVLWHLNDLAPAYGFIRASYSPDSAEEAGVARMYFTSENAGRIDRIRGAIEDWRVLLSDGEYALLLADLLRAASAVSNVAGTYGCYLKEWKPRARKRLALLPSTFVDGRSTGHRLYTMDAEQLAERVSASIVYADPPYTKRQYAAYYHVLETIARYDRPKLTGTTGLREWKHQASEFCYKARAPEALERLLGRIHCEHFFLSYSEDGQISHGSILKLLGSHGRTSFSEARVRRYRSSALAHRGPYVTERLYHLTMS